jgi:hypothetical protein
MGWFAFAVLVWSIISALIKKRKGAAAVRQPGAGTASRSAAPLTREEQIRRVREEIQRKIQERVARQQPASGTSEPRLRVPPVLAPAMNESPPRTQPALPPPLPSMVDETLERQRHLAEQIRELEIRRARIQEKVAAAESRRWDVKVTTSQVSPLVIRDELRNPQNVRKAIVLREVLGTPVGLR